MWRLRRRRDSDEDPKLACAEAQVADLQRRAHRVERALASRHERNHWSETVEQLWRGEARA